MGRYDAGFGGPRGGWRGQGGWTGERGFGGRGPGSGPRRGPGGYAGGEWSREPGGTGRPMGRHGFGGGERGPGAWGPGGPRGEYGGAYEGYGGYSGAPDSRGFYAGRAGGRPSQQRGYDGEWGRGGGFAREPFMPDEAYRRHPEYRQHRQPREWEAHQHGFGGEEPDDRAVREAVYARMSQDAWLEPERIDVQVEDGVVTLTGEVDDYMEARYAWDDAWEADGVRGVINNLTVRTDQPQEPHGDVVVQAAGERTTEEDAPE